MTWQRDCLDHGLAYLQPLVLTEVADALGMHASTVRLVIANTYLSTGYGIIALTSFFPSGLESSAGEPRSSPALKATPQRLAAAMRSRPQPAWPPGARLSPDEEQRVRQIFEAPASLPHYQAWLQSRPTVPNPVEEMRAAYHDLQTALAHPQLRPAVLLALRAFAQAAQAGVTTPPPAGAVEPGPRLTEPPLLGDSEEAAGVPPEAEAAQRHRYLAWLESRQKSPEMQEVARLVERALHTTATVLLTGERGTGKSHMARLLHDQGPRAKGPFVAVNCAAIPEMLLEAELFGYERGAFTGATQRKPGCLELATGGTLFLNEIGDMSPVLQAKLLRVLQEKQFERLGGTETITTDARIVAATHHDLQRLIIEGRFRSDLLYRLNVHPIALPPLRERQEDLGPLTMFFLTRFSQKLHKEVRGISQEARGLLERYPWPGNVRELAEVIEQAVARCQGPTVTAQDLPQSLWESSRTPVWRGEATKLPPGGITMADLEKRFIQQALEQAHGNKSQAAKKLGLSRTELRTRMRWYGLEDN
jgi:DNA-binding NtrC family response regulator